MASSNPELSFDTELLSRRLSLRRYLEDQPINRPRVVRRPLIIREMRGIGTPPTFSPIPELVRRRIFVRRAALIVDHVHCLTTEVIESLEESGRLRLRASVFIADQLRLPPAVETARLFLKMRAALALIERQAPLLIAERERLDTLAVGEATWDDVNQLAVPLEFMASIMRLREYLPPMLTAKRIQNARIRTLMYRAADEPAQG
ncbi:hypothetical protein LTR47_009171 [Exophiala xenobiotica]|nr:hypothetical protein LTR41_009862 [Exophiala xenobiotica]KAK5226281.1 hypothetical protein LTR47_009171 [Exophiala xenobiotica]KAK5243539.1 hypothetical protein LTS06_010722 [Exophiala xenobiotica]KAK5279072.1 hypothetical protein LTR40_008309 [Exophiala xenobiotica]KAK5351370.1 hypothetical protein LTR61_004719 [Exophiala xenobiotica]